jgi:hypothetical protein
MQGDGARLRSVGDRSGMGRSCHAGKLERLAGTASHSARFDQARAGRCRAKEAPR